MSRMHESSLCGLIMANPILQLSMQVLMKAPATAVKDVVLVHSS
jgi:hypothetical protein